MPLTKLNIRLGKEEKLNYYNFVSDGNLSRLKFLVPVVLLYEIIIIAYFKLRDISNMSDLDINWLSNITLAHSISLLLIFFFSILIYFISIKKIDDKNINSIIYNSIFLSMLLIGALISVFDQHVTQSISPFIITAIIMPIVVTINPKNSILLYIIAIIFFVVLSPYYNNYSNEDAYLSTNINIISACILGVTLNFIMWGNHLLNFRKNNLINKQNIELLNKNKELNRMTKALNQEINTKDKFFSIIAHDLRSPLSGTIKATQLLNDNFDSFNQDEIREMISSINESAKSVFQLLENLLQWAKIQNGTIIAHPDNFIAFQLFESNIKILDEFSKLKNIKIINNIDKDLTVNSDISLINITIQNLLSNAIKFTKKNGEIIIDSYKNNDYYVFSINDNGIGMSNELRENLFNQEYKSSRKGTEGESSSGLGLIICKEFINLNKGKLWVESKENIGTTFFFSLPIASSNL